MSATTLTIIGMIEIFIIAMAWISAWGRAREADVKAKVFETIVYFLESDNAEIADIKSAINEFDK